MDINLEMKKAAIFGAGTIGRHCLEMIVNTHEGLGISVEVFVDNDPEKKGATLANRPIISVDLLKEYYEKEKIDISVIAVADVEQATKMALQLLEKNINNIYFWKSDERKIIRIQESKPTLEYLETWVSESCNLKCKGCGNFSNLVAENKFAELEQYKCDIKRLAEIFENISRIRLMGGEPLLNPQLESFISITRETFPDADIHIATNGILVRSMSEKLCDEIRKSDVKIDVTYYPILEKRIAQIEKFLKENGFRYWISPKLEKFYKKICLIGNNDPNISNANCIAHTCHLLYNGQISHCGLQQSIKRFSKHYDLSLKSKEIYDIYDKRIDSWELCSKLYQPVDLCRWCAEKDVYFKWEKTEPKMSDWIVN